MFQLQWPLQYFLQASRYINSNWCIVTLLVTFITFNNELTSPNHANVSSYLIRVMSNLRPLCIY